MSTIYLHIQFLYHVSSNLLLIRVTCRYRSLTDAIKEEALMKGKSTTDVTLDIDEIAFSITSQLNRYHSLHQRYPCRHKLPLIYRVPKHIRHVDPVAYEPIFVSIGPYHNSAPNVLSLEREKWKCLKFVLNHNHHKELHDYILAINGTRGGSKVLLPRQYQC